MLLRRHGIARDQEFTHRWNPAMSGSPSPPPMQRTHQSEQPPRGGGIKLDAIGEPLGQCLGTFVVQCATSRIDLLDA